MIRKIVVALDYSEASLNALESAIWIANKNKASIKLLHVAEEDGMYQPSAQADARGRAQEVAEAMAGSILSKHGLDPELIFAEGFAGPSIVTHAFHCQADLIVMGAHGASGMREMFIGANAYYVMKYASCPVLIFPEGRKWEAFHHILLPLRTSYGNAKRYEYVKALGDGNDTNVEVMAMSVDTVPVEENALQCMGKRGQGLTARKPLHLAVNFSGEKNIAQEVLLRADRMQADLIVLSSSVDVINKQFFIGPFSQRIIHQAKVPVLYVR